MQDDYTEYRCHRCNGLLFAATRLRGTVTVKCLRCKDLHIFKAESGLPEVGNTLVHISELLELMEKRWEAFAGRRAHERGRVAVGIRFEVFARDGFRCRYCGVSAADGAVLHADHVQPQSMGGPTTLANLVTACMDCNLGKSNKVLDAAVPVM